MASSLTSQIALLVESAVSCSSLNALFLRSLLECAYVFGGTCGLFWGAAADRFGRRPVALLGLVGMAACCLSMGFASSLGGWVVFRFLAGSIGSSVFTSGLAMLADISVNSTEKTSNVACLPLITVCGSVGPILQSLVRELDQATFTGIWKQWPALSGQLACAGLIIMITIPEAMFLTETLSKELRTSAISETDHESENATLLNSRSMRDTDAALAALDMEFDAEPTSISMSSFLQAPSFLLLLASFSILSLHSSTFAVLLPHLGYTAASSGGMGLPCDWLSIITLAARVCAAVGIQCVIPHLCTRSEVLSLFRKSSVAFPLLYILIPALAAVTTFSGAPSAIWIIFSTCAVLAKEIFAGAAQVLALLLVFSAAPHAECTGTSIGLFALSNLFKSLAVGGSGFSYYLSDAYSATAINVTLWGVLAAISLLGCGINWKLRKSPTVGRDFPEDMLSWNSVFDAERDLEEGF
ncbi:hypothetical protein MBLNU459_g5430t2 [Dothideomycetes sp. NU459]